MTAPESKLTEAEVALQKFARQVALTCKGDSTGLKELGLYLQEGGLRRIEERLLDLFASRTNLKLLAPQALNRFIAVTTRTRYKEMAKIQTSLAARPELGWEVHELKIGTFTSDDYLVTEMAALLAGMGYNAERAKTLSLEEVAEVLVYTKFKFAQYTASNAFIEGLLHSLESDELIPMFRREIAERLKQLEHIGSISLKDEFFSKQRTDEKVDAYYDREPLLQFIVGMGYTEADIMKFTQTDREYFEDLYLRVTRVSLDEQVRLDESSNYFVWGLMQ